MIQKLRWGIIATGRIAGVFAEGIVASRMGELVAIGSRSQESADAFGDRFNVPHRYASYEALLDDKDVEAVYISTPHTAHAKWAIKAAEAGKHILCEKPLAVNYTEALSVVEAARHHDVFLMEAFMYRCHPQTTKLAELVRQGEIGEVRMIRSTFGLSVDPHSTGRMLDHSLAGGGILDIGCYPISFVRLVAGAANGTLFEDPVELHAVGHVGVKNRVDEWTAAVLRFKGDIVAQVSTSALVAQDIIAEVVGSEGRIWVDSPWFCSPSVIHIQKHGDDARTVILEPCNGIYSIEADTVAENIANRQALAMTNEDSLGNMRTLDDWRHSIGLVYDWEK